MPICSWHTENFFQNITDFSSISVLYATSAAGTITGNRKTQLMPEFTWSDTPCKNGHIGWRRITSGTSRGKTYRHSKCEQCRKDNRKKHRGKDLSVALRTTINGQLKRYLQGKPRHRPDQGTKAPWLLNPLLPLLHRGPIHPRNDLGRLGNGLANRPHHRMPQIRPHRPAPDQKMLPPHQHPPAYRQTTPGTATRVD